MPGATVVTLRSVWPVALLMGAALGAASAVVPARDTDLFWHLATARETAAAGLPRVDAFSWTIAGRPVLADQWLGQLAFYAGHAAGSWQGVIVVRTLAVAALVALIAAAALARGHGAGRPVAPVVALALAVPAVALSRALWTERPELLGAVLFAALMLLLRLPGRIPLIATAPLLVLWANVHGSFALGSGLVLLVAAYGALREPGYRSAYGIAVLGALASFALTPSGLGTAAVPAMHVLGQPRQISEEMVPDPRTPAGALWALVLGLTIATTALAGRARWRDVLVIVPTALLSMVAIRYTPLFAIAATPYIAEHLGAPATGLLRLRATGLGRPGARAFVALAALLLAAGIAVAPREPDESAYPVTALADLPAGHGLLNEYDWGGWLIWRAADTPVFIDGRLKPYRPDVLRDYVTVIEARPGWREVIAQRGIRWLLVRPTQPVAVRARELGWPVLARSETYVLVAIPRP